MVYSTVVSICIYWKESEFKWTLIVQTHCLRLNRVSMCILRAMTHMDGFKQDRNIPVNHWTVHLKQVHFVCKLYLSKALPPNHTSRGSKRGTGGHKVGGGCGRSYVPGPISWEMAKTSLGVEWGENWDVLPMVKENLVELVSELRAPWLQPSCPTSTAAPPLTGDGDLPKRNALQKHVSKKCC